MEPPASGEGSTGYVEIVPYETYPESDWNLVADLLEAQFESELGIGD